jgi:hypothetical protein
MKPRTRLIVVLLAMTTAVPLTAPLWAQTPATEPSTAPVLPTELGTVFRSRLAGVEFRPPAGGTLIRDLNSGEIVRFVYSECNWDLRLKSVAVHTPLPLSAANDGGILELTATQLLNSNQAARVLRKEVIERNERKMGLIEARCIVGSDQSFTQQAIIPDGEQRYLVLQMISRCTPGLTDGALDPAEMSAREMFGRVLYTVNLLDRRALLDEQRMRSYETRELYLSTDKRKITSVLLPLQLMRVLRDGKDVGFIQVNERLATHNHNDGVEVIVRSRVQAEPSKPVDQSAGAGTAAGTSPNISLPGTIGPANTGTTAARPAGPVNFFSNATYFVTFDRHHEDWTSMSQVDDQVAAQSIESANSDLSEKIDPLLAEQLQRNPPKPLGPSPAGDNADNPDKPADAPTSAVVRKYVLNIDHSRGRRQDKPIDIPLPVDYLPQALGQMLPRLLPNDPAQYMFSYYVSSEQKLMRRYVDVLPARDVQLDGKTVRAMPILDRIGVDGIATTQYVTRDGIWVGSVNEESKITILPSDEQELNQIWQSDKGFKVAPLPPPMEDDAPRKAK